jgi:spore germination protein KB
MNERNQGTMLDNGKISPRQFLVLIFLYTVGTTILVIPSGLAATAKQDAWIAGLVGVCFGLISGGMYVGLWRLFPNKTFVGMCEAAFGKAIGTLCSVAFMFSAFIGATTVLFYVGNFYKTHFLPQTPMPIIHILFAIVVVGGVRMGLEVIGRTGELLMPWFILLFLVLVCTVAPKIKPANLLPVYEAGTGPILWAGLSFAGTAYLPVIFLTMMFPDVQNAASARKGFVIITIAGGLCVVLVTLLCILVFGPDITSRSLFPSYTLVKKISIVDFFQRIEAIMAGLWFITTFIKTTFYFYGWVRSFAEILKLKDYRVVTLPFAMIMVVYSLVVYPDVVYMQAWDSTVYIPYILTMGFGLPLLLLVVGLFKKKSLRKQ